MDGIYWLGTWLFNGANGRQCRVFWRFIYFTWLINSPCLPLALAGTMIVAIFTVHFENGLFMSNNGYEFGLALLAASISLVFSGAGKVSLDALISDKLTQHA